MASPEERIIDEETIAARIMAFLASEFVSPGHELTETTNLVEDFFLDSFGIVNTVMFLEQTFEIEIGRGDINGNNFKDVASLAKFVFSRRAS